MQLLRVVNFHKALADPTRIRILVLLVNGPLHGQALAGKLGVTPPTITHHISKLRDANLVREWRDKNTIYFELNEDILQQDAQGILTLTARKEATDAEADHQPDAQARYEKMQATVLKNFLTAHGRLKRLPAQHRKRLIVLEHIVRGLEVGRKYTEKEISAYIEEFHHDFATIRREFIMHQYMIRENGIYELNPPELWTDWRTL